MVTLTKSQLQILSQFFSNMAVVWFAAAFIGSSNIGFVLQYGMAGIFALVLSLRLAGEVNDK